MSLPPLLPPTSHLNLSPAAQRVLHSINICTSPSHLPQIQAQIFLHRLLGNTTVVSSFFNTCLALCRLGPALSLFSRIHRPHVFVCNTLMRALLLHHQDSRRRCTPSFPTIFIYSHMLKFSTRPNHYTFPLVLKSISHLPQGAMVHTHTVKTGFSSDIYVQNSLLNLYASCGVMDLSEQLFDEMPVKEVVAWSTMIMGYKICDRLDEALIAFERMQFSGVAPNRVTMVNALAACANHGALDMGVWIHDYLRSRGWELDVVLGTSLIDMYGKCGRIDIGLCVFSSMDEKNVYTWNSLIMGLALAKNGEEALRWFFRMKEEEGIRPDAITLIGVLCACSHSKLVETGQRIFDMVVSGSYGFYPGIKHYGCMVDLLGRAGLFDAALGLIHTMPYAPNTVIWGSLLSGCRARGDLSLGEVAAKKLVELDPNNVAYYVLLSNLYAEMGRWKEAEDMRRLMKGRRMIKDASWSFTESTKFEECSAQR